ncbi:MAG TPA: hypothetical protein VI759_07350 [Dehalococcoidia bacterium]|nr:hypothetical protein [Dehalococcoidia bacterium]
MTETTKLPPKPYTVVADDLVVIEDGVEYRPHAGEKVVFKSRLTVDDYLYSRRRANLNSAALVDAAYADTLWAETLERTAGRIVSHEWTDDDGKLLPPMTVDVLRFLSFEELGWLIQKSSGARSDDESKNALSPSTRPSMGRRASRRTSGSSRGSAKSSDASPRKR